MKSLKFSLFTILLLVFSSCGSIKSTIKNIDDTALRPAIKDKHFIITEYSTDKKYGYNKDFPINLGFENEKVSQINIELFFNALLGENKEKLTYNKLESCCPFPTKRNTIGAGSLDVYEITFEGKEKKIKLYINIFERGKVLCPKGFSIKN